MSSAGQPLPHVGLELRLGRISRVTLSTAVAIVAVIIIFSTFAFGLFALVDSSQAQAKVLADNGAASLMFRDPRSAHDVVQSLHNSHDVDIAALYDKDRHLFAHYERDGQMAPAVLQRTAENVSISASEIRLIQPVLFEHEIRGSLYLTVNLDSLYLQTFCQMLATAVAVLLALTASRLLMQRLNVSVLRPLSDLSALMDRVSLKADFSVRAHGTDITELDALANGFNVMLEQIEERDSRLAAHRDHLEEEVGRRTREIFQLAYFDSLTGLPNRQSFLERVDREVKRSEQSGSKLGVLFVDLDGFKHINDTLGHHAGDLLLKSAADRLRQGIRPSDMVSCAGDVTDDVGLARLGGDEFTALIHDIAHPEDALLVARRLCNLMHLPFHVSGREVVLTASIGIALYPDDGADAATLLKHADSAMYHAKNRGRDNCQYYSAALTEQAMLRLNLENSLRRALERKEFSLVYQPQFDLRAGRILSVEALIRWNHPEQGLISPMEFIPLAEENGLIVPIGEWVLRTACAEGAKWQRAGRGLRIAVNLSPTQFKDPNLVKTVGDVLAQTGLAPSLLELEITEGAVMEESGVTLTTLSALRSSGVTIALDDFGTGYSSMSYLKRMPLNNLKVDRSFVMGLPDDEEDHAIVRAILSLAKSLGFRVTAEGVETLEQAQTLDDMECDALQGYYFGKPVPAEDIPALLADQWMTARTLLRVARDTTDAPAERQIEGVAVNPEPARPRRFHIA